MTLYRRTLRDTLRNYARLISGIVSSPIDPCDLETILERRHDVAELEKLAAENRPQLESAIIRAVRIFAAERGRCRRSPNAARIQSSPRYLAGYDARHIEAYMNSHGVANVGALSCDELDKYVAAAVVEIDVFGTDDADILAKFYGLIEPDVDELESAPIGALAVSTF